MVEKVNAYAMQAQAKQHMKKGHKDLKDKLAQIDESYGKSQAQVMREAFGDVVQNMGQQTVQDMYNGNQTPLTQLTERMLPGSAPGMTPVQTGDWTAQPILKETAIGKTIERYRIKNTKTGQTIDGLYRHEACAAQIAACLNESNNVNDPRVKRLNEWSEKEESILLETRKLVSQYKKLDEGNTSRRTIVKNKISHNKLLLENVRLKMGVM
jgi:hypothetical protein